ncbi:adhesion G protein-coupled receptor E1 isoform X2 [Latimeria chalumnae]|uniref:adhesion G protein-coupled receptor E1 isoform X2 n=1 Tax=Latimeria chalumnae TaxID=7897 RepID=UPI00313CAF26
MGTSHCLLLLGILICLNQFELGLSCGNGLEALINGSCVDIDECKTLGKCPGNSVCYNTNGSYYCNCKPGYRQNRGEYNFTDPTVACNDINECLEPGSPVCSPNAKCRNTFGSFRCTCKSGFRSKTGKEPFHGVNGSTCEDIDECSLNSTICGKNASCTNTEGSYNCTCDPGYTRFANKTQCEDIDECKEIPSLCGPNANCTNAEGSYECFCQEGYFPSTGKTWETNLTQCTELKCREENNKTACRKDPYSLNCALENFTSVAANSCQEMKKNTTVDSTQLLQDILNTASDVVGRLQVPSGADKLKHVSNIMQTLEHTVDKMALKLKSGDTEISSKHMGLKVKVKRGEIPLHEEVEMSSINTTMKITWKAAAGENNKGFAFASLISYDNIESLMSGSFQESTFKEENRTLTLLTMNSKMVTVVVNNKNKSHLPEPVELQFSHFEGVKPNDINRITVCAYWDMKLHSWSRKGCWKISTPFNKTHTTCKCDHLSSFAVLMAHYEIKSITLEVITKIGLTVSLFCLLLAIITFLFCRSLYGTRNTIHLHLCISLFLAYLIFLTGITQTNNKVGCAIVAGLLHFFFLASFCWMCLEGIQLYLMVVRVFDSQSLKKKYMIPFGYGIPLIIVAISAAVNSGGYGTDTHCWLSLKKEFLWSFLGPVCLIILVNSIFFIITVWKLAEKFSSLNPDLPKLRKLRAFTITAIAQLCILGCTWIFGIFQIEEGTLFISYLFTIFNCCQGIFIFILHCLLKKQAREEYHRCLYRICSLKKPVKYSEFSSYTASSSRSQSQLQRSKTTHETRI